MKLFAQAYAAAKGLETVTSDDIRRDFGISGKLVQYFGARTLGEILEQVTSGRPGADQAAIQPAEAA